MKARRAKGAARSGRSPSGNAPSLLKRIRQAERRRITMVEAAGTATAETLHIVAQLQTDVQPVFDAIARNAAQLCGALFGCVYRFDGELLHLVATQNVPPA